MITRTPEKQALNDALDILTRCWRAADGEGKKLLWNSRLVLIDQINGAPNEMFPVPCYPISRHKRARGVK